MGEALLRQDLYFNLHPAGQPEDDPVLAVHCHAVHQRSPQAGIELGDELRQALHALDESVIYPEISFLKQTAHQPNTVPLFLP